VIVALGCKAILVCHQSTICRTAVDVVNLAFD
jgi:hypothetical protein